MGASSNMLFPDLGAEYANRVCKSFHLERLGKLYTNSGTNMCKLRHPQEISPQNMQTAYAPRYQKTAQLNQNTDLNGPFHKEDIEMTQKHMKRCSASESIREL